MEPTRIVGSLLPNICLLLAFIYLLGLLKPHLRRLGPHARGVALGLLFGLAAVANMLFPFYVAPGIVLDLRAAVIAVAGAFGGWRAAVVAAGIVALYRASLGGIGVGPGIAGALGAAALGAALYSVHHRWGHALTVPRLFALGLGLVLLSAFWSLIFFGSAGIEILRTTLPPIAVLYPAATVLLGGLLGYQARQDELESALAAERQLLRAVIDNLPDYVYAKDLRSRLTLSNASHARALNSTPDAVVGKTDFDFFPPEYAGLYFDDDQRVMTSGLAIVQKEERAQAFGESPVWVSTTKVPIRDPDGAIVGLVGITRDITHRRRIEEALRESEANYRRIVETASEGIWLFGIDGTTHFVNQRMAGMLGYTVAEITDRSMFIFLHDDGFGFIETLAGAIGPEGIHDLDLTFRRRDGSLLPALASVSYLFNDQGKYQGALAMITDMTYRLQTQAQALELAAEKQRGVILRQFITDASHDFRTPLSVLGTGLYLLRRISDPAKQAIRITEMEDQIARINRLLNDFLDMARLDSALASFSAEALDMNALVQTVVNDHRAAASVKMQNLDFDAAANLPPVHGSSTELGHAIDQLISNAITFTGEGGSIRVRTALNGGQVTIDVADTGIGIRPEDLPRVFEHFYRADPARQSVTSATGGTGLGLALARKVIQGHGGTLTVTSTPGEGSTFRIVLPVARATSDIPS